MAGVINTLANIRNCFYRKISKSPVKEAIAECFATFVLVVLGDGVMANCILGCLSLNSLIVSALGWGLAVTIAVTIAGGVSGGHVNPAVTTGLYIVQKCPYNHVAPYIIAQYMGSFLAAAFVYEIYSDAIDLHEGGSRTIPPFANSTAQIFATYPQDFASPATCILDQVLASALLLIVICAATDSGNLRIPPYFQPMVIGLGVAVIIFAFGHNCGAPLNPARDFAPRLFTAIVGYGKGVFSYRNYQWFWIPVLAPHFGGLSGAVFYDMFIKTPSEFRVTSQERESRSILGERNSDELEANLACDVPAEDIEYQHVVDKVLRDAKPGTEASLPSKLLDNVVVVGQK